MAEESRNWTRDTEELAACFTVHARDLFGYACVLSDTDRALASDLVQATFEAAAPVWCTLRDLPAGQCREWLRDTLATTAYGQTGHLPGNGFVSPSHRRLTELKMARFRSDYDAVAGLDRFAGWLRDPAAGTPAGNGDGPPVPPGRNGALSNGAFPDGALPDGASSHGINGNAAHGHGRPGSTDRTGAAAPQGSYGDPVSALYAQHYASLVRLAALLVRDTATAEEIVQDSFVAVAAAWRRRGNIDGALDFLRQSVLDRSRSALRHGIIPAPAAGCPPVGFPPLLAALGALPARQREVLVLRYYANLSEEQAADTIGISRAAVRRHATRANAALRTLLDAG